MSTHSNVQVVKAQPGYQQKALSSPADILISGAAAGVGKTYCLLFEGLRNIYVKGFGGVIFRRTSPMIRAEGGLWDASCKLYSSIKNAVPRETTLEWIFPNSKIKFSHMQYEHNRYDWQGSEIPFIAFDELTHFTKKQFFYMLGRNRSTCGIKPYIRATCNPDPDSWVAEFIEWWIDQDPLSPNYGYMIPEREGVLRYFCIENDNYVWGDSLEEVYLKVKDFIDEQISMSKGYTKKEDYIKSLSFIGGSIYDNVELLKVNPGYLGNLNAQEESEKQRLLFSNWKAAKNKNDIYNQKKFMDIFSNSFVQDGDKYITTDIALKGSNKFTVFVWSGKKLIDFYVLEISKGNEVIDLIKKTAYIWSIPYSNILFDNDGVGQFVDGFIEGAREFNNGSTPLPNNKTGEKENYNNLKSQCYFRSGDAVNRGEYFIPPEIANKRYDKKMTLRERLIWERKAIKRNKPDSDGKLSLIKKESMKNYLNGESPDALDGFMMREWWDFDCNKPIEIRSWSGRKQNLLDNF